MHIGAIHGDLHPGNIVLSGEQPRIIDFGWAKDGGDCLGSDKLREEYNNAQSIKHFAYDQKDNFAIPIDFDGEQEGYHVLWSIFSPSNPVWQVGIADPISNTLKVDDLRKPLEDGQDAKAYKILDTTFRYLSNLHRRLNKSYREERQYNEEYDRYLRKLDQGVWGLRRLALPIL